MLISFSIKNFRSIKEKNTISFVASSGSKIYHPGHVYNSEKSGLSILKSAGLYGANASGKSNFLLAFEALRHIVVKTGFLSDGDRIACYEPYKLSRETLSTPTQFEVDFILDDDVRYFYSVTFNSYEIIEEFLDFYPNGVKSGVFYRGDSESWESIKFGGNYKGGVKKIPFFKNNSYLSKAGNNASSPKIIRDAFNFIRKNCFHLGVSDGFKLVKSEPDDSKKILSDVSKVLKYIDTGVRDVSLTEVEVELPEFIEKNVTDEMKKMFIENSKDKYMFTHVGEDGFEALLGEDEESDGTRKIFSMIYPIMEAFKHRKVFMFDELDNGLHPHIADLVIRLFNDETINKVGSQIIFSTHNMLIMTPDKMRRDQIWFVEKNEGKSRVYSLNDFDKRKVKPTTPYHVWYDDGRFGGIPDINFIKIKDLVLEMNGEQGIDPSIFGSDEEC